MAEYRPRLSVELTEAQMKRAQRLIPWGLKSQVISMLLDDLMDMIETKGDIVLAVILKRRMSVRDVVPGLGKEE